MTTPISKIDKTVNENTQSLDPEFAKESASQHPIKNQLEQVEIPYMTDQKFFIRPSNNHDIPSIKKVVFTSLMEYGLIPEEFGKDNDLNDIEKNYFDRKGFFGVLIESDSTEVIGTFGLFPVGNTVCELRKMYLSKAFRGQGLGKVLMESAIKHATDMNYQKLILETVSPLKEAIALYKKYGFTEITPAIINKRVDQAYELNLQNQINH